MAVLFVRTGKVAPGRLEDAIGFALKIAQHINTVIPEAKIEVVTNIAGNYNEVHWLMRNESLAHFESLMKRAESDDTYQTLSRDAAKQKIFTDLVDSLYRVVG